MEKEVKIFLSYARDNIDQVRELKRFLKQKGFSPWLDEDEILPGEKWRSKIKEALHSADFIIIVLSNKSITKRGFVQREIKWAIDTSMEMLDKDIYIIPVRLEECPLPQNLREIQAIDLFKKGGLDKIIVALSEGARRRGLNFEINSQSLYIDNEEDNCDKSTVAIDLSDLGGSNILKKFSFTKRIRKKK